MNSALFQAMLWSVVTSVVYLSSKWLHRRHSFWWTSPMLVAPALLLGLVLVSRVSYQQYIGGTHWLVALFAPATVAFAVPVYEQRAMIRRYWLLLMVGALAGSATAMISSWGLATWFGLNDGLRLSLLPRSMSTPFAMVVSGDIGGAPSLTAMFVLITGILGAALGEGLLSILPLRCALARGASFGMGAHGFGTAKAHQINSEVGSVAGLIMVFVGVINVLAAPLLAHVLR